MDLNRGSSRTLLWPTMLASIAAGGLILLTVAVLSGGDVGAPVSPGSVLLFRHSLTDRSQSDADPQARGGCEQQRNLSAAGVAQAEAIGRGLADLPISRVYASPFCRAVDTADAFGVRRVVVADQLISTTSGLDAAAQQAIVDSGIALIAQEVGGEDVVVMVTHTQNVEALTGLAVEEGDAVVLLPPDTPGTEVAPGGAYAIGPVLAAEDW